MKRLVVHGQFSFIASIMPTHGIMPEFLIGVLFPAIVIYINKKRIIKFIFFF